jgi:nucleoid-associated protein YgaU
MTPDDPGSHDDEMPDFSGVTGGASTSATDASGAPVEAKVSTPDETAEIHEVREGETLTGIAKHHYGNAHEWRRIFDANRDQIHDPDRIRVGWKLKIPAKPPATAG